MATNQSPSPNSNVGPIILPKIGPDGLARESPTIAYAEKRSWIVLIVLSTLLLPIYIFASTILQALGHDEVIAKEAARIALCEKQKNSSIDIKGTIAKLEKNLEESQRALRAQFHELASELKAEITKELLKRNVSTFSMAVVKRNYAFERSDIPHEENYVLKISYPFKDLSLPSNLKGNNFTLL